MKIKAILIIFFMSFAVSGCSANSKGISGTVIDAETGKPIEGAIVAVKWSMTKGVPGLTYGETYKVAEAVTDVEGKFRILGVLNPIVNPPVIVIYKKDYIAWNNNYIFPDSKPRDDTAWKYNHIFKLERFIKSYSHSQHISFFRTGFASDLAPKLAQAYSIEVPLAEKERDLFSRKLDDLKQGKKTESQIWQEIMKELYLTEMREQ